MFFRHASVTFLAILGASHLATAAPTMLSADDRAACDSYVIISTRGTTEAQGPSIAFTTMIRTVRAQLAGGIEYDTVYPAELDQNSSAGTADILKQISTRLASCPGTKFALLGYSQGAAATVNALQQLAASSVGGQAVKAVFLVGDPFHLPGKESNEDQSGGKTNAGAYGIEAFRAAGGIPAAWDSSGKVLDICYEGDGVCSGDLITIQHTLYGSTASVQTLGSDLLIQQLQ